MGKWRILINWDRRIRNLKLTWFRRKLRRPWSRIRKGGVIIRNKIMRSVRRIRAMRIPWIRVRNPMRGFNSRVGIMSSMGVTLGPWRGKLRVSFWGPGLTMDGACSTIKNIRMTTTNNNRMNHTMETCLNIWTFPRNSTSLLTSKTTF